MEKSWKIAIIGSGPAGFYATGELFKQKNMTIKVDMFDLLPTPFGLVRGGVAPDHQKIKSTTKIFTRIAEKPDFRFFGNVEFGKDVSREELLERYDAVLYAVGSPSDRSLGIPGEDWEGSYSATEFVAWYNGHPKYRASNFDLTAKQVLIFGVGNVALDVARILALPLEELKNTDISDHALKALGESQVEDIWVIGRRGPLQAAFSPPVLREMMEITGVEVLVDEEGFSLDEKSQQFLETEVSKDSRKNHELLKQISETDSANQKKRVHFLFLASPTKIQPSGKTASVKIQRNQLVHTEDGRQKAQGTEKSIELEAGLVFRSIGYKGVPLKDVPFDEYNSIIPNKKGQLFDPENNNSPLFQEYVAGWIKRGPSGVVGTNKQCAVESIQKMLETFEEQNIAEKVDSQDILALLESRNIRYVSFDDWKILDAYEVQQGAAQGRPRVKVTSVEEMLKIISEG